MVTLKKFVYPESLEEALEALAGGRESARPLAGGTSLIFFRGKGTEALVDITRLGLDRLEVEDDVLLLGAGLRLSQLGASPLLDEPGLLALGEAARRAGSQAVRNAATLGGNVVGYKRWSDTPNALVALGARVEVARAGVPLRTLSIDELFAKHPQTVLEPGDLLTRFMVPRPPPRAGSAYVKFGQTRVDYALASAAARVVLDDVGRCVEASVVIGAVEHLPVKHLPALPGWLGEILLGERLTRELLSRVGTRARETVQPASDMRASGDYLRELAGVVVQDALGLAAQRALGEETNV